MIDWKCSVCQKTRPEVERRRYTKKCIECYKAYVKTNSAKNTNRRYDIEPCGWCRKLNKEWLSKII